MNSYSRSLPLAAVLLLSACGGGGGGSSEPETPAPEPDPVALVDVSGKAFDGYVVGATVWMDINGNGVQDESEPSAVTESGGDYTMELDEEQAACLSWSTIYVDVPVGAMDETEGEVQEAYRMSLPPSLDPEPEKEGINISPLTTVVWDTVATELREQGRSISCDSLANAPDLVNFIESTMKLGTAAVVQHYNVAEEKIYSDFIADGDAELQAKAVEIVRGLQAGLRETIKLAEANPDADVRVTYYTGTYLDDWQTPDTWYRQVYIWRDGDTEFSVVEVSDDLVTDVKPILRWVKDSTDHGTHTTFQSTVWETRPEHNGVYACELKDAVSWTHEGEFQDHPVRVTNIRHGVDVTSFEDCAAFADSGDPDTQYVDIHYKRAGFDDTVKNETQFTYFNDRVGLFDYTINSGNVDAHNLSIWGAAIESLPWQWQAADLVGTAQAATRYEERQYAKGEIQFDGKDVEWIFTVKQNDLVEGVVEMFWRRTYLYFDGTTAEECAVEPHEWLLCDDPTIIGAEQTN